MELTIISVEQCGLDTIRTIHKKPSGQLTLRQIWRESGYHCEEGPACIRRNPENGVIFKEEWYHNGEYHRIGAPALITRDYETGDLRGERWCQFGQSHRVDGPANTHIGSNGELVSQHWYQNGQRHRLDGPAIVHYGSSGIVALERWLVQNVFHRADGPAEVQRNGTTGEILSQSWYLNGVAQRHEMTWEPQGQTLQVR